MPNINRSIWDGFIDQHPDAHLLQTSSWGELKSAFGWDVEWVINGELGAQILFRSLRMGFKMAYIPKGPIGIRDKLTSLESKFSIYDETWATFWQDVDRLCLSKKVAFLKIEPDVMLGSTPHLTPPDGFMESQHSIQPLRTIVVDITFQELQILARMKQKTRYNIHLAEKRGVTVRQSKDVRSFYNLVQQTSERDQFGVHSLHYFTKAYETFNAMGECELFIAEFENQPLAGVMVFAHGKRAWYFYGGSSNQKREYMPSYLAQWQSIRWAKARGCTSYDLWGIPDRHQEDLEKYFQQRSDGLWGVYRFKRGFGGQIVRSVDAWDRVYIKPIWLLYRLWMRWFHSNLG